MKYRQKPVVVEAFLLDEDVEITSPKWFQKEVQKERIFIDRVLRDGAAKIYGCTIQTHAGKIKAKIGDYIIQEPNGEITVCSRMKFKEMYERMKDGS